MSFKTPNGSPYHRQSPSHSHSNDQGRNNSFSGSFMSSNVSMPAWGSPAVGFSPRGNRPQKSPYKQFSPRANNHSMNGQYNNTPSGNNYSQNRQFHQSPRHQTSTPSSTQNRFSSPNDVFKTPQSPLNRSYSSPASYNSFNSSGRQYNQRFQQNSRRGHFSQRGGSSIEDYYNINMLEDPWKFTPPVPVMTKS